MIAIELRLHHQHIVRQRKNRALPAGWRYMVRRESCKAMPRRIVADITRGGSGMARLRVLYARE